ncbi:MAG: hypothetical protein QM740_01750 [Acidovorax sp.]
MAIPLDQIITFGAGLWMAMVGFGRLNMPGQSRDRPQAWVPRLTWHFRWMGPLLMALSIALLFAPRP